MIAAEDFSYYLQQVSGTFWWIGAGTPEQGCVAGLPTFKSEVQQVEELYHNILPRVSSTPDISSGDSLAGTRPFLSPHRSLC